ncbi:MAG: outer membrane lipoprotein chaperone LolA [Deltaproteobacteria bacterium]|nr:outer membrane lipoprotein chaperone LolA [Candidatus Zymogenaceae bacterium]
MKRIAGISLLLGIVIVISAGLSAAAEESVTEVINKLQAQYDQTLDFSATFTQETISKSIGAPAIMNGKVYIKKPGMMRLDYTDPKKWQIISDGQTSWLYFPEDKQVRIYKTAEAFENLPFLNFLFGKGKIADDFTASFGELDKDQAKDSYLIVLAPKNKDSTIDRVLILVSRNDYLIKQLNTYDVIGTVIRIAFKDIALNSGLKDSMFHFIVPPGVETFKIETKTPPKAKGNVKIEIIENNKK